MFILQSEGHLCKTTPVNVVVVFLDQFFFFFLPYSSVCVNLGLFLFLTFRSVPLFNKACDILPSVALQQQRGVNLSLQSRRSRQYVGGISSCLYLGPAGFQNCRGFFFFSLLNELTELG